MISKWAEIKPLLLAKMCSAICLQETHFLPTDQYDFRLTNYTLYNGYANSAQRQGGVSIYVTNDVPHYEIPLDTPLQAVACSVKLGPSRISVCSLYLPPNERLVYRELDDMLLQLPQPCLLCTDANSRHFLWGADRCDSRGNIWERVIQARTLHVLNDGAPTRMDEYTGLWSHIDVSLSSSNIGQYLQWEVDTDLQASDHLPIYITYDRGAGTTAQHTDFMGWNINRANWSDFADGCDLRFVDGDGMANYRNIAAEFLRAAHQFVPKTHRNSKYSCPWWNDQCKEAIRSRKRAYNRHRRSHLNIHLLEYKAEKAKTRRVIRQAKRESWERLLHMFTVNTPMQQLWDILRKFTRKERYNRPFPVLKVLGHMIDDPFEVANILGKLYSDLSSSRNYRHEFRARERVLTEQLPSFHSHNEEIYNDLFTISELRRSINKCGNTSIGPDRLHYAFFRSLHEQQLQVILDMINYIWRQGHLPDEWKHSVVIPLLKPGKPRENPDSYRPIQLTSCFCKIMERMVTQRLSWYVEQNQLISKYQCAFRKGRSTTDHLVRLESEVRRGFFYNRYTLAIFLDLKSAYNLTSRVALLTKMHSLGFRGRLMYFVNSYLENRTFQVRNGTLSDTFEQENGLVQGGVLSPILFNIMINDVFTDVPDDVSCALYADDCSMWVQGRRINSLAQKLQSALDLVSSWADRWGFTFSPHKCQAIVFRRYMNRRELDNLQPLQLYDQPIPYTDTVRFLGVVLDSRLNLNNMFKYVKTKAVRRLSLLKCLSGKGCGADRSVLLRIYKSLIRPILDYACTIYDGPQNKSVETLEAVQNECLRIATGAFRTSPVMPLLVDADILPLKLRRYELTLRYSVKVRHRDSHPSQKLLCNDSALHCVDADYMKRISGFPIFERLKEVCRETGFTLPTDVVDKHSLIPPWRLQTCLITRITTEKKGSLGDKEVQLEFNKFRSHYTGYSFIYTDGAKTDVGVGCAFFDGERCQQFRLPSHCCVFTAEAFAILQALIYADITHLPYVICTDSLSVVSALQSSVSDHPIVTDIMDLVHRLTEQGRRIIIVWVPGHCGIYGNEVADVNAKLAIDLTDVTAIQTGPKEYYSVIRRVIRLLYNRLWTAYNPFTTLRTIKDGVGSWASSLRKDRREEIVLCRLRLGHTRYTHSYLLDKTLRPECDQCQCPLTIQHILLDCTVYAQERRVIMTLCQGIGAQFGLRTLLGNEFPSITDAVFIFLRRCDLMKKL